jgi:Kef-type K+ transport system membrane component KefB
MDPSTIESLLWVLVLATLAPVIADIIPRVAVPVVVLELVLGILAGPHILGIIHHNAGLELAREFGVIFLYFLAGFEVDFEGIRGNPLRNAIRAWVAGFTLALAAAFVMERLDLTTSFFLLAIAISTTSLGSLMPILQDSGQLHTRFGTNVLSLGAIGEFAPVLLVAFALNRSRAGFLTALAILAFLGIIALILVVNRRAIGRNEDSHVRRIAIQTLDSSAQFGVRISILLLIALVYLAARFDLDVLLGAFAGGFIVGQLGDVTSSKESRKVMEWMKTKFEAIGYGVLVPIFFIVTGVEFRLDELLESPKAMLPVPAMVGVFFIVRGLPVLLGYRRFDPPMRLRLALVTATQLPLLVTIVARMVEMGDIPPDVAAGLIGAAVISVTIFPILGFNGLDAVPANGRSENMVGALPEIPKPVK